MFRVLDRSRSMVCLDSRIWDIKAAKAKTRVSLKDKAKKEERKVMEKASPLLFAGAVVRLVMIRTPSSKHCWPDASQHPQQSVVSTATTVRRVDACEPLIFDFSHVPSPSSLDIMEGNPIEALNP